MYPRGSGRGTLLLLLLVVVELVVVLPVSAAGMFPVVSLLLLAGPVFWLLLLLLLCASRICWHLLRALGDDSRLADSGSAAGNAGAPSATTNLQAHSTQKLQENSH